MLSFCHAIPKYLCQNGIHKIRSILAKQHIINKIEYNERIEGEEGTQFE